MPLKCSCVELKLASLLELGLDAIPPVKGCVLGPHYLPLHSQPICGPVWIRRVAKFSGCMFYAGECSSRCGATHGQLLRSGTTGWES